MPMMMLEDLQKEGREYQALMRAELGLQQQTRALLKRMHGARDHTARALLAMMDDLSPEETQALLTQMNALSTDEARDLIRQMHGSSTHQARAFLKEWLHGLRQDRVCVVPQRVNVIPPPCMPPSAVVEDQINSVTQETSVATTAVHSSQGGDQRFSVTLSGNVPAWLRLRPRRWLGDWEPQAFLADSEAAQTLIVHAQALHRAREVQARRIAKAMAVLPIWTDWGATIRGLGPLNLALVLCETGDLWHYPTVAKVWKRMGVGLYQGEIQQRKAGLSQEETLAIGYQPERRSIVYNVAGSLINGNKVCVDHPANLCQAHPGPYRQIYLDRKGYEQTKAPDEQRVVWHMRAHRYLGKCVLRDLWNAWRTCMPHPTQENIYA